MTSEIRGDDNFDSRKAFTQEQTWQNMSASRVQGVDYTNDTGRAIQVKVTSVSTASARSLSVDSNVIDVADTQNASVITLGAIVPNGSTYNAFNVGAATWWELR